MALHDEILSSFLGRLPKVLGAAFAAHGERFACERATSVVREGTRSGDLILLFVGGARELMPGNDGAELTLGFHAPGALLLTDETAPAAKPRTVRYEAMTRLAAVQLAQAQVQEVESDAQTRELIRSTERARLRRLLRIQRRLAFEPAAVRCADALVELCNKFGVTTPNGLKIVVPFTMIELARFLNLTPRHLRRFVPQWEKDGVLGKTGAHLEVLDFSALKRLARPVNSPPSSQTS